MTALGRHTTYYDVYKDLIRASHLSFAAALINVTTCIEENNLAEVLDYYYHDVHIYKKSTLGIRKRVCRKYSKSVQKIYQCVNKDVTPENEKFIAAFYTTVKLHFGIFCKSENLAKMASIMDEKYIDRLLTPEESLPLKQLAFLVNNKIPSTQTNYCLPFRAAEAFELAMIKNRKIPF